MQPQWRIVICLHSHTENTSSEMETIKWNKNSCPLHMLEVKTGGESFMVWDCFAASWHGQPAMNEGSMDSALYSMNKSWRIMSSHKFVTIHLCSCMEIFHCSWIENNYANKSLTKFLHSDVKDSMPVVENAWLKLLLLELVQQVIRFRGFITFSGLCVDSRVISIYHFNVLVLKCFRVAKTIKVKKLVRGQKICIALDVIEKCTPVLVLGRGGQWGWRQEEAGGCRGRTVPWSD